MTGNKQTEVLEISHLHPADMQDKRLLRSKLFEDAYDRAIVGKSANRHGRVVHVYDEDVCIDIMLEQLEDAADGPGEVEWEDAAASITQGLDWVLRGMGVHAPVVASRVGSGFEVAGDLTVLRRGCEVWVG